jgi:hypothetical protein
MLYCYNDGGRADAGHTGSARDCVVRAIAIVTRKLYNEVYNDLYHLNIQYAAKRRGRIAKKIRAGGRGSSPRQGLHKVVYHSYILQLGLKWQSCMGIGTGCKVHLIADELPKGRIIVRLSKHLSAVIDGEIHDTFNPCRADASGCAGSWSKVENGVETHGRIGERCVYGYYYYP